MTNTAPELPTTDAFGVTTLAGRVIPTSTSHYYHAVAGVIQPRPDAPAFIRDPLLWALS